MSEGQEAQDQCYYALPTLSERFWRWAGFRYHLGDEPEGADAMVGWMRTDMRLHFGWPDRLRLLFTGKLFVASIVHSDTPSPSVCKSRIDWRIFAPGEKLR
jgi:hypothetical protein